MAKIFNRTKYSVAVSCQGFEALIPPGETLHGVDRSVAKKWSERAAVKALDVQIILGQEDQAPVKATQAPPEVEAAVQDASDPMKGHWRKVKKHVQGITDLDELERQLAAPHTDVVTEALKHRMQELNQGS